MRGTKTIIWGIVLVIAVYLTPSVFASESQSIVINELMWSGSSVSSSDEWIELYNPTQFDIDLTGWKLTKLSDNQEVEMIIISSGTIKPGGYFLIANSSKDHLFSNGESVLNITPDLIDSSISLSNDSLQIKIYDQSGKLIDEAGDGGKPLAGNNANKYSMERNAIAKDGQLPTSWHTATESINFDLGTSEKGTPGSENSPPIFTPCAKYPESVTNYIDTTNCLEAVAQVNYVIDGDTINIILNGEQQRVRLIGVDAPESAKSSDFVVDEPYYQEAKEFTQSNLVSKSVKILTTPSDQFDSYDRLLGVVVLDNQIFNIDIIKQGLAQTFYLSNPLIKSTTWETVEQTVQRQQLGIWNNFGIKSVIYINEFIPNPEGKDSEQEWIELYNSSDQVIDLSNWFLDDEPRGSSPYLIPKGTVINPKGYLVIKIADSKIGLNNNGDQVRLISPSLTVVDEVSYTDTKTNWSYNRAIDGSWYWYFALSPGEVNQSPQENYDISWPEEPVIVSNIQQARELSNDQYIVVEGYVTAPPAVLSTRYFYIQDETAAIQIYSYYQDFPEINLGDYIVVYGQLSGNYYRRVKTKESSWIRVLTGQNKDPPITQLEAQDINSSVEGTLIEFIGRVVKLSGQTFYLEDDTGTIKITIRDQAGFKRQKMKKGDIIKITGIVYCTKSGCSILPRYEMDIEVLCSSVSSKASTTKTTSAISSNTNNDDDSGNKNQLANFYLAKILHNQAIKNQFQDLKGSIILTIYAIIVTVVACIFLLGERIWKQLLLAQELSKLKH